MDHIGPREGLIEAPGPGSDQSRSDVGPNGGYGLWGDQAETNVSST
jgi:hypothetical protein